MANTRQTALLQKDLNAGGQLLDTHEREHIFSSLAPKARSASSSNNVAAQSQGALRKKPIREFLARCIHALLYNLMHLIFSISWTLRHAYSFVIQRILAMRYYHHRTPALIQKDVNKLPRLPRHLSIILDGTGAAQDSAVMAKLINDVCECSAWAACAGIQVLSIYERHGRLDDMLRGPANQDTGILKSAQPQLHEYITRTLMSYYGPDSADKPTVSLRVPLTPAFSPPSTSPDPDGQGSRPSRHLSIIMLSEADGRRTLVDLAKTLAEMSQKRRISPQDISTELIDAEISESVVEEPDLVILFGGDDIMLQGYPPWQIRLSEI